MKRKRRIETSKKALFGAFIFSAAAAVAIIIGWFKGLENAWLFFSADIALLVSIVKYYMQKAGEENVLKLKRTNGYTDDQIDKILAFAYRSTGQENGQNPQG